MAARRADPQPPAAKPRILVITPPPADAGGRPHELARVIAAADVAAVVVRTDGADVQITLDQVAALAPLVQARGVALLTDAMPELVVRTGADGLQASSIAALKAALAALKPDHIVGAGGLKTRHDAMVAGELGADYVMFGDPGVAGRRAPFADVVERVAWWAELFEVPCVGFAAGLDEVAPLVTAGADFVAVGDLLWSQSATATRAIQAVAERLAVAEPAR